MTTRYTRDTSPQCVVVKTPVPKSWNVKGSIVCIVFGAIFTGASFALLIWNGMIMDENTNLCRAKEQNGELCNAIYRKNESSSLEFHGECFCQNRSGWVEVRR